MTSTSNRQTVWQRVRPFVATFFLVELLLRAALLVREWKEIEEGWGEIARAFLVGVLYDAAVFCYILAPFLLFLGFATWYSKRDRIVTTVMALGVLYLSIIHSLGEWFWWDDIGTRCNYIAWDYLEYPEEVTRVLLEAFHGYWILAAVAVVTPLLGRWLYPRLLPKASAQPSQGVRRGLQFTAFLLPLMSWGLVDDRPANSFLNEHLTEVARNGMYRVGSTFWSYHLPHEKHFVPASEDVATRRVVKREGEEKRHNVIVVVMESMSACYMERFGNEQGLTPNLDRISRDSLFFVNHYACGTRTVRGVEAVSMGLPPIAGPSRVKKKSDVTKRSMGSIFAERGYDTRFFYNGHGRFDNMGPFLGERGFTVTDRAVYLDEEIEFENLWGVSDEDLYRKVIQMADQAHANGEPFMHMIMTMSNHRPFTYPERDGRFPSGKSRDGAVHYSDYAVGRLIEEAKKHPWFKDTLFLFTADHTAFSAGKRVVTLDKYHIPLIVYAPHLVEARESGVLACQADIAPTVAGLLNFSYDSYFLGRDLLHDHEERAFISNFDHLALAKEGMVTVLTPEKEVLAFTFDGAPVEPREDLVAETAALYQTTARF